MIVGDVGNFSIFSSLLVHAPFDFTFYVIGGVL